MTNDEIQRLIEDNQRLIPFFIIMRFGKFPLPGYTEEECWHLGRIGLFLAARRWNGENAFSTYAVYWVFQTVIIDIQARGNSLYIDPKNQNQASRLKKFCRQNNISLADLENASAEWQAQLNLSAAQIKNALQAIHCREMTLSLNAPIKKSTEDDDGGALQDLISDETSFWTGAERSADPAKRYEEHEYRQRIRDKLLSLINGDHNNLTYNKRELLRRVILMDEPIAVAGRALGLSRATAHHKMKKTLEEIRKYFRHLD